MWESDQDPEDEIAMYNHSLRSYCCRGGLMSTCEAASDYNSQRQCKYFKKKKGLDRCYHLRFEDHCDSIDAQKGE